MSSYITNTPDQQKGMLETCGVTSLDSLFDCIPEDIRPKSFDLPGGKSELEVKNYFERVASRNYSQLTTFIGGGIYDHFIPAAVDAITGRSEFYTAYTPYQPEISQGTLQAIYEYQSDICRLTDMEVSNASLYDGGTALFEASQMALASKRNRSQIVVDGGVNPIYRTMLKTYTANLNINLVEVPVTHGQSSRKDIFDVLSDDTAAVIVQNPNFFGVIDDHTDIVEHCHEKGILVIQSVYPVAMSVLKTPGEMGVDIVTGEGQSIGLPLGFGGPYLGFMATTKKLVRKMPGRVVGRTVDNNGKNAFVLTMQAREQHIRRGKATSNICSNEALCALRAHVHLSLLGPGGLKNVAELCLAKTNYAKQRFKEIPGVEVMESSPTFNEFTVKLPIGAMDLINKLIERNIAPGLPLGRFYSGMDNYLLVAVTEKRTKHEIGILAENIEDALRQEAL